MHSLYDLIQVPCGQEGMFWLVIYAGLFWCFHNPLNPDTDYSIFNVLCMIFLHGLIQSPSGQEELFQLVIHACVFVLQKKAMQTSCLQMWKRTSSPSLGRWAVNWSQAQVGSLVSNLGWGDGQTQVGNVSDLVGRWADAGGQCCLVTLAGEMGRRRWAVLFSDLGWGDGQTQVGSVV